MTVFIVYLIIAILIALYIIGQSEQKTRSKELEDYVNNFRRQHPPKTTGTGTKTGITKCSKCGVSIPTESNRCG